MRKFALSILNCFIGVSCFAGLPSDTTYYYYHDASLDKVLESKTSFDDEVLMIVSEGNTKSCYFYGCSNEFSDDPAEGVTPGFIVLKATSWSMENGKFSCVLNSTNHKYTNRPVNAGVVEEIPNGYNPWLQINDYFWSQIELVGTYNSKKIELVNKTLYPEEKKVFRKISSSEIMQRRIRRVMCLLTILFNLFTPKTYFACPNKIALQHICECLRGDLFAW